MKNLNKNKFIAFIKSHIVDYPTPVNLNYFWSFGSAAGICLAVQILTGIFLAMHYCPHVDLAYASVEHIMRDVKYGWFIRYLHANGASMFFIVVYFHIFRGLFYGSYAAPRQWIWFSGVLVFVLMMATAFMGYVLPWGQMSFWGATVITNLFSAVPLAGGVLVEWLWGGFSVDNATLNRFFSLHYLLPFLIVGLIGCHLGVLHDSGSNNPIGSYKGADVVSFYPYFYVKDLLAFVFFLGIFCFFIYYFPNTLGHTDNYIKANSLVTPAHIVPEWYFLPFYAILRSVPNKLGGVLLMFLAIILLLILPFLHDLRCRGPLFRPLLKLTYFIFILNFLVLGWIGQQPAIEPYIQVGMFSTAMYFIILLYVVPLLPWIEEKISNYIDNKK